MFQIKMFPIAMIKENFNFLRVSRYSVSSEVYNKTKLWDWEEIVTVENFVVYTQEDLR